jgi:hypothetical protein
MAYKYASGVFSEVSELGMERYSMECHSLHSNEGSESENFLNSFRVVCLT